MWSRSFLDRVVAKMQNGRTQIEPFPLSVSLKVLMKLLSDMVNSIIIAIGARRSGMLKFTIMKNCLICSHKHHPPLGKMKQKFVLGSLVRI